MLPSADRGRRECANRGCVRPVDIRTLVGLVLAGLICLLAGCSGGSSTPPATGSSAASAVASADRSREADLNSLLQRLVTAVDQRDSGAFDATLSDRDPGFASTAQMIMNNLLTLKPSNFTLRGTGRTRTLTGQRAKIIGAGGYAAEVKVSWSVPGDRSPSDQDVWLTLVPSGDGLAWAGTVDGPRTDRPTPLWWLEPIRYSHDDHAAVIGGSSVDSAQWLARADRAVAHVAQRLSGPERTPAAAAAAAGWNKRLVIIVPSNEELLEQMLGVPNGAESALAAVTWPDGSRPASAPDRVMINPAGIGDGLAADIVLTHETVHVATRSPESHAPTWLIEGLADDIAYDVYPQGRASAAVALLRQVKKSGPPTNFPDEQAFRARGDALELAYSEAWTVCYSIAGTHGTNRLLAFYAAVGRSPTGNIGPAARSTLGVGQDQLVSDWRDFLRRAAERGSI